MHSDEVETALSRMAAMRNGMLPGHRERERERKSKMGDILIAKGNDQRQPQIGKCMLDTEYRNIAFYI